MAARIEQIAYDFRPRSCTLDYSFGVPFQRNHFEHEENYRLDIDGDLVEPKLKNLKGASVRLYSARYDLMKSHENKPSRPIGSIERSKGYFAAYVFVPVETVRLVNSLVVAGTMGRILLFSPPMERLRAKVSMITFTSGNSEKNDEGVGASSFDR